MPKAGNIGNVKVGEYYQSKTNGFYQVLGYDARSKKIKVQFLNTGCTQFATPKQCYYGFVEDPIADGDTNVMRIGYSDGYDKSDYQKVWKLWMDILMRYQCPTHRDFNKYGAKYNLFDLEWIHFHDFLQYYNYRESIGRPILDYRDPELCAELTNRFVMVRLV